MDGFTWKLSALIEAVDNSERFLNQLVLVSFFLIKSDHVIITFKLLFLRQILHVFDRTVFWVNHLLDSVRVLPSVFIESCSTILRFSRLLLLIVIKGVLAWIFIAAVLANRTEMTIRVACTKWFWTWDWLLRSNRCLRKLQVLLRLHLHPLRHRWVIGIHWLPFISEASKKVLTNVVWLPRIWHSFGVARPSERALIISRLTTPLKFWQTFSDYLFNLHCVLTLLLLAFFRLLFLHVTLFFES